MPPSLELKSFRFDVAFSFAGSHRDKVRAIAEIVSEAIDPGIKDRSKGHVFFDEWFEHEILGPNMRVLLQSIYYERSLMVVADVSNDYADRPWTQAEAEAIDALRMTIDTARDEIARLRLVNIRFDNGNVPGILDNTGWIDARKRSAEQIAETLIKRRGLLYERMGTAAAAAPPPLLSPKSTETPIPILFFHPATNDERYSRREKELKWLDDCARDTAIRIATVTGQGGLGKTSLVGHWIEKHHGWQHRAFRSVFFYSFYSNRDPKDFFAAFLKFVCEVEKIRALPEDTPLHHLAAAACRKWSYLVVLNGLEVLQHGEDDPTRYGWIADGELTEFVARVGAEGASLLVLTSRFPFPKITDEHPDAARKLELPMFTKEEGADLLMVCGLKESRDKLEGFSELVGGHPLALRIFAGACTEQWYDDPDKVAANIRSPKDVEAMPDPDEPGLSPEESQKRRQRRQFYKLLRWFQQKLSPPKRRLLQLVALFRDPVRTDTLAALALGLDAMKADFTGCDAARITGLLDQLSTQFLLQKETSPDNIIHWTAHPIVRDVFREAALAAGDTMAKQFAEIVAGKGEGKHPKTVVEALPIVEAIEVLLAAGDFAGADELYLGRFENGYVFMYIPAPQEGLRCARAFLDPPERREAFEKALRPGRLAFYLNEIALWANILGETDGVEQRFIEINEFDHKRQAWEGLARGLVNVVDVQTLCGKLRQAISHANEALFYAGAFKPSNSPGSSTFVAMFEGQAHFPPRPAVTPTHNEEIECVAKAYRANALSLAGAVVAASRDFVAADSLKRQKDPNNDPLGSIWGVQWLRHRISLCGMEGARLLTVVNHVICERNGWKDDLARYDVLLGELDLFAGNIASAHNCIAEALRVLRTARHGKDLPDALLAMAQVQRATQFAQKNPSRAQVRTAASASSFTSNESAISYCEESLRLAARSGFLLKKCDALNIRSLLLRESGQLDKALAAAKEAHDIAQRCDYYWGIHEALRQLRETAKALNRTAEFREWDKAERDLTEKMKPEIAEALRINREHDAEMEKFYGKKKK